LNGGDSGFGTGCLYDYKSFDELMEAYKKHVEHYVFWHISMSNLFWLVARDNMPLISASATIDGCMESGKDVMSGARNTTPAAPPGSAAPTSPTASLQ
jgi:formate C-acetyltransferase